VTALRFAFGVFLAAVSAVGLPSHATASPIDSDLDRDGIRDSITVEPGRHLGVSVWLSKTNTVSRIRTKQPIASVAAVDLDGDGHPDIVATDTSARLHVWRVTPHGRLRVVRPRPGPGLIESGTPRLLREDSDAVNDGWFSSTDAAPSSALPPNWRPVPVSTVRRDRCVPTLHSRERSEPNPPRGPPASLL
jgi:hypothetical protein